MPVRVLAFFDTRYQRSSPLPQLPGTNDPWQQLRDARPPSRQHGHINWPSSLGAYDLADRQQTGRVVGMAAEAGIDGFVVEIREADDRYVTGAEPLVPLCRPAEFGLAFHWSNRTDRFWASPADPAARQARAAALIAAISRESTAHVLADGRPVLIIDHPLDLAAPEETLVQLRKAAAAAGLPGLYLIGNRFSAADLAGLGFDAAVDPSPGEWASCPPSNHPSGLEILEMQAGLRDAVEWTDKFYPYALFAVTRMHNRQQRGKVFPRAFPAYQNWPGHLEGGATVLVTRDGVGSIDRYIYGLFIENAIAFAHENFAPGERMVFLESWNNWLDGSQIEPSVLDGDLIYNATRSAIDKGRYVTGTRGEPSARPLPPAIYDKITQICEAAAAAFKPSA